MHIYGTATDHLNNHPYLCEIPAYYDPKLMQDLSQQFSEDNDGDDSFRTPIFQQEYGVSRAMIPISTMIHMLSTKVSFVIVNDIDIVNVLLYTEAYVEEVVPMIDVDSVRAYIPKVQTFHEEITRTLRRVCAKNPNIGAAFTPKNPFQRFLMESKGGGT
jgi:hypothetical protein